MSQLLLATEPASGRCGRCEGLAWLPDWIGVYCGACGYRPGDAFIDRDGRKRHALPEQGWAAHMNQIQYDIKHPNRYIKKRRYHFRNVGPRPRIARSIRSVLRG